MLLKLSVIIVLVMFTGTVKADSFFVASIKDLNAQNSEQIKDHIIPLVYIKDMEYYNHTKTSAYTGKINEQLSLEPNIITTEDEDLADFYLIPKLLLSKIERINSENSRYSMSVALELWAKGGVLINTERQNRYIIIENSQNPQEIARKLLLKLLEDAVNNLSLKIKNNQLKIG